MKAPKANIIQSGNQDPIHNNQNINQPIEEPEIEEPDFIKDMINNNGNHYSEEDTNNELKELTDLESNTNNKLSQLTELKPKYNIIELFCLVDDEIFFEEKQVHLTDLSFNLDFGNLKITYYKIPPDAIEDHVIFKTSMNTLISGTIYPSSAFRIMNSEEKSIVCMEQLINKTNEQWQRERPMVKVIKNPDNTYSVIIYNHNKNSYQYDFKDWQKQAFENSLEFVYNQGFNLRGQKILGR